MSTVTAIYWRHGGVFAGDFETVAEAIENQDNGEYALICIVDANPPHTMLHDRSSAEMRRWVNETLELAKQDVTIQQGGAVISRSFIVEAKQREATARKLDELLSTYNL